jgi:hypothetical protein
VKAGSEDAGLDADLVLHRHNAALTHRAADVPALDEAHLGPADDDQHAACDDQKEEEEDDDSHSDKNRY